MDGDLEDTDGRDDALHRRVEALTNGAWFCGILFGVFLVITVLSLFDPGLGILLLLVVSGAAFAAVMMLRGRAQRALRDSAPD